VPFTETTIVGAYLIEPSPATDARGLFARTFDAEEFVRRGLDGRVSQCNTSFNPRAGTLRGLHYQAAPHGEAKLVRCTGGAIFDVAVDLRAESATYLRWFAAELRAENRHALFIPAGCAHGFQTLADDSEVLYQMSTPYVPGSGRGVRWNDPAFGITWPDPPAGGRIMSERDADYPDLER
jgi:dTDP-4-dehydrorhamnose 3,5-epimerase